MAACMSDEQSWGREGAVRITCTKERETQVCVCVCDDQCYVSQGEKRGGGGGGREGL